MLYLAHNEFPVQIQSRDDSCVCAAASKMYEIAAGFEHVGRA